MAGFRKEGHIYPTGSETSNNNDPSEPRLGRDLGIKLIRAGGY